MGYMQDSREPVTTCAEVDIVGIHFQATTSEGKGEHLACAMVICRVCELAMAL
jgi:hypothetical protein